MSSYSKILVIGRLGKDPEIGSTKNNKPKCTFSLAENRGFGDDQETIWYNVTIYGQSGENAGKMLKKGSLVAVEGQVNVSAWNGDDGKAKSTLYLNVGTYHEWRLLADGKSREESNNGTESEEEEQDEIPF